MIGECALHNSFSQSEEERSPDPFSHVFFRPLSLAQGRPLRGAFGKKEHGSLRGP